MSQGLVTTKQSWYPISDYYGERQSWVLHVRPKHPTFWLEAECANLFTTTTSITHTRIPTEQTVPVKTSPHN